MTQNVAKPLTPPEGNKGPHRFKAGESGNPNGRPKRLAELHALSQANFPLAVRRLGALIESSDDELAFRAIQFVFLYILGKPPEASALMHVESMRARLTELVVPPLPASPAPILPEEATPSPSPDREPPTEVPIASELTSAVEPPAAPRDVAPPREPAGFVMTAERAKLLHDIRPEPTPALAGGGGEVTRAEPAVSHLHKCIYRVASGEQCGTMTEAQWCPTHKAKLFGSLT